MEEQNDVNETVDYRELAGALNNFVGTMEEYLLPHIENEVQQGYFNRVCWKVEEASLILNLLVSDIAMKEAAKTENAE